MRILRIGILNLNSLRGEQTIDFTASPLADHQLYAIVGPTGAGKTTILDAITLALYGQTERNKAEKDRKDGSGSVMTYGEGECRAELEYETAKGRFKNVWHRQRAHKNPDRDLTASRREISKWNPELEDWDILATKKRDVDTKTEETVGLDYERFVRSVMLTQGDFARFLKSDPGDKAAILEKITGTAVYRDLSMAAYTRSKLARERWERATEALAATPPFAEELRKSLEAQLAEQQATIAPLKKELAETLSQLGLHENLKVLRGKEQAVTDEQSRLDAAWTAATNDRQRLAKSDELQGLRADLNAELRLATEDQQLSTDLTATEQESTRLAASVTQSAEAVATAQEKLNVYYQKLPEREKKFAAVADLEREISILLRDTELDSKRKKSTNDSLRERRVKAQELAAAIAAIRKDLAGMEPEDVQKRLTKLEASITADGAQKDGLLKRIDRRRLQNRLKTEMDTARQLDQELAVVVAAVQSAQQTLATAETALADRRTILTNLIVSQSLAEHKTNLEPGEECPVCGAIEHPGLENFVPVTDSVVERTRRDVNQALTAQEKAKQLLETERTKEAGLRRKHDGQRAITAELNKQLGEDSTGEQEPVEALEKLLAAVTDQLAKHSREQEHLRRLQTNLPRLTVLKTELAGLDERIRELVLESTAVEAALEKATAAIDKKRATIKSEVGERTAEQCRELTRKRKDELIAALAAAEKAEVDVKGQQAALASRQAVLRERKDKVSAELAAVRGRLAEQLGPKELSVTEARQSLLSESDALHLRARLNDLATKRSTAATVGKNLDQEISEAAAKLKNIPTGEALEQARTEKEFAVSEADRLIGALELQLRQDDARIAEVAAQKEQLEGLRKESDRWQRLNDLIGSADGKKFRSYAQAITLQQLIAIGNDHLRSINPRYRMEYAPPDPGTQERLDMVIIDQYQNDNRRTMATLSGGESFLISLALALGLSDLASGKSLIQSLFIDEGFGTLDGKTLDQAMTTLEQLQAQGKTIGLISHVPQLRERIYCQIQLERVGDGYSRVQVRG